LYHCKKRANDAIVQILQASFQSILFFDFSVQQKL